MSTDDPHPPDPSPPGQDVLFRELTERIDRAKRSPRWWARAQATPVRRIMALIALALVAALVFALDRRPDWASYPMARGVPALGLFGMGAVLAVFASLRPVHRIGWNARSAWLWVLASLVVAFVLAAMPPIQPVPGPFTPHTPVYVNAVPCLLFGLATGLPVFFVLRWLDRGTPFGTVLAAAAAGLAGNLALELHCPVAEPLHRVAGHATVGVVLLVAVLTARRRWGS